MATQPALPPGFVYEDELPPEPRRKPASGLPPIPDGFVLEPDGTAHDGDTFGLRGGGNARLFGADAFELDQTGTGADGAPVPLGFLARTYLGSRVSPDDKVTATGKQSYGRPVVTLEEGGADVGEGSISAGFSLPAPDYLKADPERLNRYVETQRGAIAAERGAYAGTYQRPDEFRHLGADAPTRGKIPMTDQQRLEYAALLHDPKTTEAQLGDWIKAQGHAATNVGNILSFVRRNPGAKLSTYFQQQDVQDAPVLPDGPGLSARVLGALNEGVVDTLGAPVDLVNSGMGLVGLPVSDKPFGGSESIRSGMHAIGIGQDGEGYAPRSTAERYGQSIARGVGQVMLPAGGMIGAGGRIAAEGAAAARGAGAVRKAARSMARDAAARPGLTLAGEVASGIGAGVGGQAARDAFPDSPMADLAGQIIGGALGGIGGAAAASRGGRPVLSARRPVAALGDLPPIPEGFVLEDAPARAVDRLDIPALAPARGRDVIEVPRSAAPVEPDTPASYLDTSPPVRPQPVPRSLDDVLPEVQDWVASQGARAGDGEALPDVMLHGSPYSNIDQFDPYGRSGYGLFGMGTYLTDHPQIAAQYTKKGLERATRAGEGKRTIYAVDHQVRKPLDMDAPAAPSQWEAAAKKVLGDWTDEGYFANLPKGASNEQYWREIEDFLTSEQVTASEGAETMDSLVRSLGHDGITHIGGGRVGDGPRHRVVIALDPEQTAVRGRLPLDPLLQPAGPRNPDWIDTNAGRQAPRQRDRLDVPASPSRADMASDIETPSISAPHPDVIAAAEASQPTGQGQFGPIHADLSNDYPAAVHRLRTDQTGEVPGVLSHPGIGAIDLPWGEAGTGKGDGYGLAKIVSHHPEVLDDLPNIVAGMDIRSVSPNRVQLESADHKGAVRLDYDGERKAWLMTAFEKGKSAPALAEDRRVSVGGRDGSPGLEAGSDIVDAGADANLPPIPPGFVLEEPQLGRPRRMDERASAEDMAALARTVEPQDVQPIPSNAIDGLDEAMRANPGTIRDVRAPNERDVLPSYRLREGGPARKDPLDLIGYLRTKGGLRDHRGELESLGIDNKARPIEFAKSEGFLGKLIDQRQGMGLDDAAYAAWEAGFFPDHVERPTVSEFLDALGQTHSGGPGRVFHPDDFDTLDAYRGAQAQRGAVETAAQEGAPLAEDIGQPIGPEDLDANQPPATAYEDLPAVGGKAGNIRLDGLGSVQDIRRALTNTDAKVGGFDAARRGVVTQAETEALAREMGMTADDLLTRRKGQALNAEQALAARQILAKSADELVRMAGKAVGGSDADKAAFRQAWVRHVAIQEQVAGATAEAGRALQQFRMTAESKAAQGRIHRVLIDEAGGGDRLEEAAQAILDLEKDGATPGAVAKFAQQALKPKLKDKLVELYYNSLLSGPQTHVVNVLSNAVTAGLQIPEHATAAAIGAARRAVLQSRASTDRVLMSEVGARVVGLMQGTKDGLAAFARTARTGVVPDHVSKVEAQEQHAISGLKGRIIRTPTRMLSAEDELFKAIGRRMEVSGLATRQARLEGLKGDDLRQRIVDLTNNPTDDIIDKSMDYARYLTFQRPLGALGNLITAATQHAPLLKLIIPFVRTPTNILKFAAERSPAAPILKEWRADFMAGGARRDLAVAKVALGSGLGMLASQWAQDGKITGGGPADKGARSLMMADGWQPYSVKLGDKYYSYQRFDPLSSTLGVAADLVETSEHMTEAQRDKAALLVTASIIKNLSNKVWLSGVTNVSQAIEDPDRYAGGFLAQMAGSMVVPGVVAQTARVVDPVLRDARDAIDRIKSRVPVLSQSLMPKRDVFGEVISSEGGVGPDMMSPMRKSTARNDPVVRELLVIEASIGKVPRKVKGRELTADEYDAYQQMAGQFLRGRLEDLISSSVWPGFTTEEKKEAADKAKEASRKSARQTLRL